MEINTEAVVTKCVCPVVCCHLGCWDFRKAKGPEGAQAFLMYVAKLFEQILEFCQHVTTQESYYIQFRGIFDFEGFEYRQVTNKDGKLVSNSIFVS